MSSLIKNRICLLWVLATAGEHNWIMLGLLKTSFFFFLSLGSKVLIEFLLWLEKCKTMLNYSFKRLFLHIVFSIFYNPRDPLSFSV